MSRGPDIGTLVTRAIIQQAAAAGVTIAIDRADWRRWSSATFSGAQHRLTIGGVSVPELRAWMTTLADADFAIRDHLVADLVIAGMRDCAGRLEANIEILTVEAR